MKKVTMYEADDGTLFTTEQAATRHDELCALREWYEEHQLWGNHAGSRVDWEDLVDWVTAHGDKVLALLNAIGRTLEDEK